MPDEPVSGGAPAPDATPVSPSTTPSPDSGAPFSGLGEDFDDLVEVTLPSSDAGAPAPEPAAVQEVKPPAPPPVPPVQAKAPEPPKVPAVAPPAEGPKETTAAPSSAPLEPRTLVEQITQHRGDILNELAATRFAWDPGEQKQFTEALETDATKALVEWAPKLMSRMYYESATMALNHINQFVPVLLNNYVNLMKQHEVAERQFFSQFPQLNKQKHWNDVIAFAQNFNRAQPNISQADLLAMVGAAVMAKNKLVGVPGNGAAPPVRKPVAQAFVPAQAGGASPVRVVTEPESPWAGLGQDIDE